MNSIKDCLPHVLQNLKTPEKTRRQALLEAWPAIAGKQFAPHTKPSLTEDGKLFVWVDRSVLAFELNQRYKQSILKRAQAVVGENEIHQIFFRVGQIR